MAIEILLFVMHTVIIFIALIFLNVVHQRKPPDMSAIMTKQKQDTPFSSSLRSLTPDKIKHRRQNPKGGV